MVPSSCLAGRIERFYLRVWLQLILLTMAPHVIQMYTLLPSLPHRSYPWLPRVCILAPALVCMSRFSRPRPCFCSRRPLRVQPATLVRAAATGHCCSGPCAPSAATCSLCYCLLVPPPACLLASLALAHPVAALCSRHHLSMRETERRRSNTTSQWKERVRSI